MDNQERATVFVRRSGSAEGRLRQAVIDGLVRTEVQQDIETVLRQAEETKRYAENMETQAALARQQADKARGDITELQWHIASMQQTAAHQAEHYRELEKGYQKRQRTLARIRDGIQIAVILMIIFSVLVAADTAGRFVFDAFTK